MKTSGSKRAFALLAALSFQVISAFGAVTIGTHPAPVTAVADGTKITLQVLASSDVPGKTLSYQWFKQSGASYITYGVNSASNSLVFPSAKLADAGMYKVIVTENGTFPAATAESNAAEIIVNVRPKITVHPLSTATPVTEGGTATFTVTVDASGAPNFSYTWQKKVGTGYSTIGVPTVTASTTNTLTLPNVQLSDAGSYRVSVTNPSGITVNSNLALLKVNSRPVILTPHATAVTTIFGATSTLRVVAGGNAPFTYRWLKNNVVIPKSNSATLVVKGTDNTSAGVAEGPGSYKVQIVNAFTPNLPPSGDPFVGSTITESAQPAAVQVIHRPKILTQPQRATIDITSASASPSLSVVMDTFGVEGNEGLLQYQWQKDGKNISDTVSRVGTNTATLSFTPISWDDRGSYRVIVKNEVGTITSASAVLTVISPPIIISQPVGPLFGATGGSIRMSVVAGGTAPLTYAWKFRPAGQSLFNDKPVGTSSTLTLSRLSAATVGEYQCTISNTLKAPSVSSSVTSNLIYLQVDDAPKITQQTTVLPYNATPGLVATPKIPAGQKLHLRVVASGTNRTSDVPAVPPVPLIPANPLTYQWFKNNVILPTQTAAELVVDPAQISDSGRYTCTIQNFSGKVTSTALTITVSGPPAITTQPTAATSIEESAIETSVAATGSPTLKYKWRKQIAAPGGFTWQDVPGKTLPKLSFPVSSLSDNGTYKCVVSNDFGFTESNTVDLTVNPIPAPTLGPVVGLSSVEFFPTIARAGERVRIFGSSLKYTKSVKFGTVSATYVIESDNSILVTVPADAPQTATPITVASKNGPTNTAGAFTRTTDFANLINDSTILLGTQNTIAVTPGDNRFAAAGDLDARVFYLMNLPKRSTVSVAIVGGSVGRQLADLGVHVFLEDPSITPFSLGPDGVTRFPRTSNFSSNIIGYVQEALSFTSDFDDQDVVIMVTGTPITFVGLASYGPFNLRVGITKAPPLPAKYSKTSESVSVKTASSEFLSGKELDSDSSGSVVFSEVNNPTDEPHLLWEVNDTPQSGETSVRFSLQINSDAADGDDQFGWQLVNVDGNPLGALWVNPSDGSLRLVQPDGSVQLSPHRLVPGAEPSSFEVVLNSQKGTWTVTSAGHPLVQPLTLPPGSSLGSIYGAWDKGSDGRSSGAFVILDDLDVRAIAP